MPKNTRYDKLSRLIRRDFERAKTLTNSAISANSREILVDGNAEGWREDNSVFAQFRPYNTLSVDNQSTTTVRVFLNRSQDLWFDVDSGESRELDRNMYFNYVEVSEIDGASINADDIQVSVGRMIDSRELRLLEMSGMLNVGD